ncbi:hypothetical protein CQW23_11210 [Capsicum baccatum]|uniref:Uncharacterized protein n=1 Tax=Capsicum baccatum TaxID=33114 RepID=A0A2G2X1Y8_CAPBA|nr:hypothetical protein CQW23_11210 [Capsicum baccatum]
MRMEEGEIDGREEEERGEKEGKKGRELRKRDRGMGMEKGEREGGEKWKDLRWNSTLEAISFSVPIVAMPQILDQIIDTHFIEKVWGVELISKANDGGEVRRYSVASGKF